MTKDHSTEFFPECATLPDWMKSSFSDKTTRIIGGQVAPSPIPWQAHLYVDNISRCAAVIIDEETVLTAALAIMENPKSTPPVLFDIASLKIEVGVVSQGDTTGQTRGISEIIIHPCARRNKEKLLRLIKVKKVEVDLAILKLDSPLVFDDKVKPICLPDVSFEPGTVKGVVSGWGMTIGGTLFL